MPIKVLQQDRLAQFPCIGKLRKGGPKEVREKNGRKFEVYGKDLDHFRFVTEDESAAQAFRAYYGDEPKEINVYFPFGTAEENFQAWLEEYRAGGLVRRCDGETICFHRNANNTANLNPIPCLKQAVSNGAAQAGQSCGCKEVGRLMIIIPQLARLAYVTVETHSVYDIIQLTENLQAAQALRGDLRGIPFILSRHEREISTPSDNGRVCRSKSLLFIEPDPSWVQRQLEAMRLAALPVIEQPITVRGMLVDKGTGEILASEAEVDDSADGDGCPGHTADILNDPDLPDFMAEQIKKWRALERPQDERAKFNHHGILAGAIDELTGDLHYETLSALFGRPVNQYHPLSKFTTTKLLSALKQMRKVRLNDGSYGNEHEENPDFDQEQVDLIQDVGGWVVGNDEFLAWLHQQEASL